MPATASSFPQIVFLVFSSCKFPEIFKAGPLILPSARALSCCLFLMILLGRQRDTEAGVGVRRQQVAPRPALTSTCLPRVCPGPAHLPLTSDPPLENGQPRRADLRVRDPYERTQRGPGYICLLSTGSCWPGWCATHPVSSPLHALSLGPFSTSVSVLEDG